MEKKFKVQPLRGVEIHNAKSVGTRTVNLLMGEHQGEFVRGDIMDANAVVQAIDELKGGIDTGHDSLAKLNEEVKTNATVINGTITYANKIAADLEQEVKNRDKEMEDMRYDILNKNTEFEDKDELLENKIVIEARNRANADDEINKKIDVINGDSKTDGSIKKAIADVIDAAPEAYDTLKEIADKLKDNDDLHAVIQEAITEKASNEALTNEVNRATAKETEIVLNLQDKQDNLNIVPSDAGMILPTDDSFYFTGSNDDGYLDDSSNDKYFLRGEVEIGSLYYNKDSDELFERRGVDGGYIVSHINDRLANYSSSKYAILCGSDIVKFMVDNDINNNSAILDHSVIYSYDGIGMNGTISPAKFLIDLYNEDLSTIKDDNGYYRITGIKGYRDIASDTNVFNTNGGVIDTTKFISLDDNNKIADSYIPTTVALKTDLSEYIKTADADSKYLAYNIDDNGYKSVSGTIAINSIVVSSWAEFDRSFNAKYISKYLGKYLLAIDTADLSDTKVYNTNGGLCDLNNYAKLTDGKVNTLIGPADITSTNGDNMAAGIDSVNTDSVTLSELATAFNSLLQYTKTLESALRTANLLHYTVISE